MADKAPSKQFCQHCAFQHKYDSLKIKHNNLVTNHNNLVDDASAIMKYAEDIRKALFFYATDTFLGDKNPDLLKKISDLGIVLIDPGKQFAAELHDEMVGFFSTIAAGNRPVQAYANWVEDCKKAAAKMKEGTTNG